MAREWLHHSRRSAGPDSRMVSSISLLGFLGAGFGVWGLGFGFLGLGFPVISLLDRLGGWAPSGVLLVPKDVVSVLSF